MNRLKSLAKKVDVLYGSKVDTRDEWSDWLYKNHVLVVVDFSKMLAKRYRANEELAQAASLLHDIADYKMARSNPKHEEKSLELAEAIMKECGYSSDEVDIVVNDAIRLHSCHNGEKPRTKEGLVLAAADSMAHLKTDFYLYAVRAMAQKQSLEASKKWTLDKIERDLKDKINFEDLRQELHPDYEMIKTLFSR